jgi:hypothetical protein
MADADAAALPHPDIQISFLILHLQYPDLQIPSPDSIQIPDF